ncbi:MAG: Tim44 domain-containing protein [Nitrospinota bacterium]
MKSAVILFFLLIFLGWPAHVGVPVPGQEGLRLAQDEAQGARFGGGRSQGFRGSRGFAQPSAPLATPRSQAGAQQSQNPGFGRSFGFGGFGGGLFAGMGGLLLGGLLGSMLFGGMGLGRGIGGGIGLLEILLIGGAIFLLMRMLASRRREAPAGAGAGYAERLSQPGADPYGVGGGATTTTEERPSGPVYTGPDIAPRGSRGPAMPAGPGAGPDLRQDPRLEEGLRAIAAADRSFSRENFLLDARRNFMRFQEAWVARDLALVREIVDRDIYEKCQGDLDELRREGRVNRLDDIQILGLGLAEAWQEEGHDFASVRVEASLLDYLAAETTGELLGGSRTEPVRFTEYWTWARKSGPNPWFLSAIEQG